MQENNKGLIHLYCGEGKGKTTASIGLIVRASGVGYKVVLVQFFKSWETGEINTLEKLPNVKIIREEKAHGFTWELNEDTQERLKATYEAMFFKALEALDEALEEGGPVLLVMDEVIGATSYGYLTPDLLVNFLKNKPDNVEVVMTGRDPLPELLELADYISNIDKVKHPFDRGILARKGIEY